MKELKYMALFLFGAGYVLSFDLLNYLSLLEDSNINKLLLGPVIVFIVITTILIIGYFAYFIYKLWNWK
jgi:hypothetical protein